MLTLIENGDLYSPEYRGKASILIDGPSIIKIGEIDRHGLDLLTIDYEVIDATERLVVPGIILFASIFGLL